MEDSRDGIYYYVVLEKEALPDWSFSEPKRSHIAIEVKGARYCQKESRSISGNAPAHNTSLNCAQISKEELCCSCAWEGGKREGRVGSINFPHPPPKKRGLASRPSAFFTQ